MQLNTDTLATPATFEVSVAPGLDPGSYSGSVALSASGMPPVTISVTNSVSTVPTLADVSPPKEPQLLGDVNPSLPTVVLTHGLQGAGDPNPSKLWTGNGSGEAQNLIGTAVGKGVNVLQFVWPDAFQCELPGGAPTRGCYDTGKEYAHGAGLWLSQELSKPTKLGASYAQPIHFIGHSLGTVVNTYAAASFLRKQINVQYAQFTALDRPDHTSKITFGILPDEPDFGPDFFETQMFPDGMAAGRTNLILRVDNYYGDWQKSRTVVGDKADGAYNYGPLENPSYVGAFFGDCLFSDLLGCNDHNGVQDWYRWTINPTDFSGGPVCSPLQIWNGLPEVPLLKGPMPLDPSSNPCGNSDTNKDFGWRIAMEGHADPATFLMSGPGSGFPPVGDVPPPNSLPSNASISAIDTSGGCSASQTRRLNSSQYSDIWMPEGLSVDSARFFPQFEAVCTKGSLRSRHRRDRVCLRRNDH